VYRRTNSFVFFFLPNNKARARGEKFSSTLLASRTRSETRNYEKEGKKKIRVNDF
jgi:hypothetical protein